MHGKWVNNGFFVFMYIYWSAAHHSKRMRDFRCSTKWGPCIWNKKEKSEYDWAKWPIRPELIPVSVAWSDWEYFYSPLDGMLVHCRVTPSIKFAGTHLYTWVERGTVRVKCLAQEHNTLSPARAQTQTTRSAVQRANQKKYYETTFLQICSSNISEKKSTEDSHVNK